MLNIKIWLQKRLALGLLVSVLVFSIIPTPASAVTKIDSMSADDSAKAFVLYKALRVCFDRNPLKNFLPVGAADIGNIKGSGNSMSQDDAQALTWFYDGAETAWGFNTNVGVYGDSRERGDGQYRCYGEQGKEIIENLMRLTGYQNGPEFLCAIGFKRERSVSAGCSSIQSGSDNDFRSSDQSVGFARGGDIPSAMDTWWQSTIGASSLNAGGIGAGAYSLYFNSFVKGCRAIPGTGDVNFKVYDPELKKEVTYTTTDRGIEAGSPVNVYFENVRSCSDLAGLIDSLEDSAIRQYVAYLADGGAAATPPQVDEPGEQASSCVIDGVGWIVCSAAIFMAQMMDGIYELVASYFLVLPPINVDVEDGTNGVYNAWQIIQSLANVAFVIVFLIIIFAQLTSIGVSNYGVKKTLPRLIIGAILVNTSFWIAAIAVDLSNVLGAGIYQLLSSVKESMNIGFGSNWVAVVGALLSGGYAFVGAQVAGGAAAVGLVVATVTLGPTALLPVLFFVLPAVLGALIAVLIVLFVLVARQALVIILIIVAPLAFVALLLPNTEKLFTQWRQLFLTLLLMYPIISIIFGGAQIAGLAIMSSGAIADGVTDVNVIIPAMVAIITGQLVMVLPFFFLPMLITKFSGGNIDKLAGSLKAKANGLAGRVNKLSYAAGRRATGRSWSQMKYGKGKGTLVGSLGRQYDQFQSRQKTEAETYAAESSLEVSKRLADDEQYRLKAAGGDAARASSLQNRGISAIEEYEAKATKEALTTLERRTDLGQADIRAMAHPTSNVEPAMRRAAISRIISTNDVEGMAGLIDEAHTYDAETRRHMAATFSSASNRPAFLGMGAVDGIKNGVAQKTDALVADALKANAYSPGKVATGDKDELAFVNKKVAESGDAELKEIMRASAQAAFDDERLAPMITKNKEALMDAGGVPKSSDTPPSSGPPTPPSSTPPPTSGSWSIRG